LSRSGAADAYRDEQVDEIIRELAAAKVGGAYWGAQPALPDEGYTVVRLTSAGDLDRPLPASLTDTPLVWADQSHAAWEGEDLDLESGELDPWHLLSRASQLVCHAGDEVMLVAGLLGVPVSFVLASGAISEPRPLTRGELRTAVRDQLLTSRQYHDPFSDQPISVAAAILLCSSWRELINSNRDLAAAFGFAAWKRPTTEALLWSGFRPVAFDRPLRELPAKAAVAVWMSRVSPQVLTALGRRQVQLIEVEDGFIRSAGLGANCVPPLSIVVDRLGVHFDSRQESELEQLLQHGGFDEALLKRAEAVRCELIARGLSKYGVGAVLVERRGSRRHILVPGQVEDDRAVLANPGGALSNLRLLKEVRAAAPDAYIIYKPHPDVEAGHRTGAIPDAVTRTLADEIMRDQSITSVIAMVDEVHVNSSLAGFEALLRGKPVTTYGVPFYAGWGLTTDRGPPTERRTARLTLPELVAGTLLVYPRYLDPVTGVPCPIEVIIQRLSQPETRIGQGWLVSLRRIQGRLMKIIKSRRMARC